MTKTPAGFTPDITLNPDENSSLNVALVSAGLRLTSQDLLKSAITKPSPRPFTTIPAEFKRLGAEETILGQYLADDNTREPVQNLYAKAYGLKPAEVPQLTGELWENQYPWQWLPPRPPRPDEIDPTLLDFIGRAFAASQGAALVGVAPLNEDFLYSSTTSFKTSKKLSIIVSDEETPKETEEALLIPRKADKVLILAFWLDPRLVTLNEALLAFQPKFSGLNYYRQINKVLAIAEFINRQGYTALPSAGGLMVLPAMGILAGLGQAGRHGLLITPEYGPNIRLFSIVTDWPFELDTPIDFGATGYCDQCKKCCEGCPVKAIPETSPNYGPAKNGNQPGGLKWYVDQGACLDHWLKSKAPCQICLEVCPYVKEPMWAAPGPIPLARRKEWAGLLLSLHKELE